MKIRLKKLDLGLIKMIKVKKRKILLLPGDGIGHEVIEEVEKVIKWFNSKKSLDFQIDKGLVGGAAF